MTVYITFFNGDTKMFEGEMAQSFVEKTMPPETDEICKIWKDDTNKFIVLKMGTEKICFFLNQVTMIKIVE